MKVLVLAVICFLATAVYANYEEDYAVLEDVSFLGNIRESIGKRLEQALDRIRGLVEKHKPLLENVKAKITELKEKVRELVGQAGTKFFEALQNIRDKVRELLRDVIAKITKKEDEVISYALYDNYDQSFLQQLGERLRARFQNALERVKALIEKHKGALTEALKQRLSALKEKLQELAKEHGPKLLEKARDLGRKISQFVRDLLAKIGNKEEYALYAAEEEQETFLQALKRRITQRLQTFLENLKEKIAQAKTDLKEKLLPLLEEIRQKISDLAQKSGEKLLEAAGQIRQRIQEILKQLLSGGSSNYAYYFDIDEGLRTLKTFFLTDDGIAALKDNADKATPTTPTGLLIKTFILASTKDALKELIGEMFKGFQTITITGNEDILALVRQAGEWLVNNVHEVREYAKALLTNHPVVARLRDMLLNASDEDVKVVVRDIFTLH